MLKFGVICTAVLFVTGAQAQSVPSRVTNTVGGVTGAVPGVGGTTGGGGNPYSALNTSAGPGGEASGGLGVRVGDKTVTLKGAVGVDDGRSGAFRAGAGVPF
ncbi:MULTISPECIES: hypothetical protein [unclassified Afipia]|uniref:hypothetical protein n=1 Tax=unclassified Afipia TaxID=2642050 RepID=UPI0003F66676|nr:MULTISPECIES: hypothetical protein [unclassified Afipia]